MKRTMITDSKSILSIGYDDTKEILEVTFHPSGTYHYFNVEHSTYKELMEAGSKGEFVNKFIKGTYEYEKIY